MFIKLTSQVEFGQSFSFGNGCEVWVGKESAAFSKIDKEKREQNVLFLMDIWFVWFFSRMNLTTEREQNITALKSIACQADHRRRVDLGFDSCLWLTEINYIFISN